jgi:hypothetical protein
MNTIPLVEVILFFAWQANALSVAAFDRPRSSALTISIIGTYERIAQFATALAPRKCEIASAMTLYPFLFGRMSAAVGT